MSAPLFAQIKKTFLKQPMTTSDTSLLVNSLVDVYGNAMTIGTLGSPFYFTISPGGSDEEICSATGITQNADGTCTISGLSRGLSAVTPYAGGGTAQNHGASTPIVFLPDNPQLLNAIITYVNGLVLAAAVAASDTAFGYVKTTENLAAPRVVSALVSQQGSPNMTLFVNPFALSTFALDVVFPNGLSQTSPTFSAPASNPRLDLLVYDSVNNVLAIRAGSENASLTTSNWPTYKPTPTQGDVVLCAVFHRTAETKLLERDDSTNGFIIKWYPPAFYGTSAVVPAGNISAFAGRSAPTGFLLCDGSAVSRTTYAGLFGVICGSQTFTVTVASPGVFTASSNHNLVAGDKLHFTTTGGLPSGLVTNTDYYVIATGLTATNFEVALSPGGAAVVTTGSQSGVHTLYKSSYGKGDGSTTFNVPDLRSRLGIGLAATAPTTSLSFEPAAVSAGSDNVTIINTVFPSQGQKVQLTTTGTLPAGLSLSTDYWIVRSTSTTIKFATSQGNANAATPIVVDITDQGTGVHTLTFTNLTHTVLGKYGGEDTHANSTSETPAHTHGLSGAAGGASSPYPAFDVNSNATTIQTNSTGLDLQHNNMQPYVVVNYIIKT